MRNTARVLPVMENVADNLVHADALLDLGEDEGAIAAHFTRVAIHHFQVGADRFGEDPVCY